MALCKSSAEVVSIEWQHYQILPMNLGVRVMHYPHTLLKLVGNIG